LPGKEISGLPIDENESSSQAYRFDTENRGRAAAALAAFVVIAS
jgi:hypothetical protein